MRHRLINIFLIFLFPLISFSQETNKLTYEEFISMVKDNHPILVQMDLIDQKTAAYGLKAKGGFDPSVNFNLDNKSFDEKNYYNKIDGRLKIPTWFGLDLETGYETNDGEFLNSENSLPANGLIYAGLRIPLGNGLIFDERRRVIEEAKIIGALNDVKRIDIYNKLIQSASKAYITWLNSYVKLDLFRQSIDIVEENYVNTLSYFEEGVGNALDTVESKLLMDTRRMQLLKVSQEYFEAFQNLNTFLWSKGVVPLELEDGIVPEIIDRSKWQNDVDALSLNLDQELERIPDLMNIDLEIELLENEKRLVKESLKPNIDLKINPLIYVNENNQFLSYSTENYKVGADFYYPIFNRKTRGNLKLLDIDMESNSIERQNLKRQLKIQIQNQINDIKNLSQQIEFADENAVSAAQLLEAEKIKFEIGESSIFLVNTREQKKLEYELKVIDLEKSLWLNRIKLIQILQAFE